MHTFKKRSAVILPKDVGKSFYIYNGKTSKILLVTKEMVFYKFGSFFFTRKRGKDAKSKKLFF